jgi:hypothetical protein
MRPEDRIMFEIYREQTYNLAYRVVYFTELNDHNKDAEIERALAGDHVFDGYLAPTQAREGKQAITGLLRRLNNGEAVSGSQIGRELDPFLA